MAIIIKKSALIEFQKAIFLKLQTISGIVFYDHVPESEGYPFAVVRNMDEEGWGTKDMPGSKIELTIDILTQTKSSLEAKAKASDVIETFDEGLSVEGFSYIYHTLEQNEVHEMAESVYISTLIFDFYLMENNNGINT